MRTRLLFGISVVALLVACTPAEPSPNIAFLGISKGALNSDVNALEYQDRFSVKDRTLVSVVGFDKPYDGMEVTATWYTPDDRNPPIGRTTVVMASGATIARFSFGNQNNWQKSPYMFHITATTPRGSTNVVTASGSKQFYIGMTDAEVQDYRESYAEWQRRQTEREGAAQATEEFEQQLVQDVGKSWKSSDVFIAFRRDLTGDGIAEYALADARGLPAVEPPTSGLLLFDAAVRSFALLNRDGETLLRIRSESSARGIHDGKNALLQALPNLKNIRVAVLATGIVIAQWQTSDEVCTTELPLRNGAYAQAVTTCKEL